MTLENARIWYKAFKEQGRTKEAAEMLAKHPELEEKPKTAASSRAKKETNK